MHNTAIRSRRALPGGTRRLRRRQLIAPDTPSSYLCIMHSPLQATSPRAGWRGDSHAADVDYLMILKWRNSLMLSFPCHRRKVIRALWLVDVLPLRGMVNVASQRPLLSVCLK